MFVLLTNDDGIHAEGLWAAAEELRQDRRVTRLEIIAPQVQQSGVSHSITYLSPLVPTRETVRGQSVWVVNGTPADCVKLGVMQLLDQRPDLVISGINEGLNTGINAIYSGTVAAAREATFFRLPGVALSLEYAQEMVFSTAASISVPRVLGMVESMTVTSGGTGLLNVNIPQSAANPEGSAEKPIWKYVPMKLTRHDDPYITGTDPKQRHYYWSTDEPFAELPGADTDVDSIAAGAITVTPMSFDLNDYRMLQQLNRQ